MNLAVAASIAESCRPGKRRIELIEVEQCLGGTLNPFGPHLGALEGGLSTVAVVHRHVHADIYTHAGVEGRRRGRWRRNSGCILAVGVVVVGHRGRRLVVVVMMVVQRTLVIGRGD